MIKDFFKTHPIHKRISKKFDYLFLLRPTLFFPVWIMLAAGMAVGSLHQDNFLVWQTNIHISVIALFIGMTLLSGATFIINQIIDKEGDKINKKLFLVAEHCSPKKVENYYKMIGVIGIIFLLFININILICGVILFLSWGIIYNLKPFQWKRKPVLGMLINTFAGLILFISGWSIINTEKTLTDGLYACLISSTPYLLCFTSVSLLTTLPDINGDKKTGNETFPIKFGKIITMFIGTLCVIIASYIGYFLNDPISSTSSLVSLPFFIWMLGRRKSVDIIRTIRFSIFNLAFFLMVIYPYLFFASLITFYLSKYYYWHRFNLHYPTFIVES